MVADEAARVRLAGLVRHITFRAAAENDGRVCGVADEAAGVDAACIPDFSDEPAAVHQRLGVDLARETANADVLQSGVGRTAGDKTVLHLHAAHAAAVDLAEESRILVRGVDVEVADLVVLSVELAFEWVSVVADGVST